MAGGGKSNIYKKADVIGKAPGCDFKARRLGDNYGMLAVRRQDAHFRKMDTLSAPMIDHGEFDERDWQLLHHDVLKDAHQRKLVAYLKPHVVTKERIEQLQLGLCGFDYRF